MKKILYCIGLIGFCAFLALVATGLLASIYAVGHYSGLWFGETVQAFAVFFYSLFLLTLFLVIVE